MGSKVKVTEDISKMRLQIDLDVLLMVLQLSQMRSKVTGEGHRWVWSTSVVSIKDKSIVFLVGAVLDLISSQRGRDYNGKIYCVTPAQYGVRYTKWHPDNRLTSRCPCVSLLGSVRPAGGSVVTLDLADKHR